MPHAHEIQAVAFDLDGLMVNTEELYNEVCDVMCVRRGKRATPELLAKMMGRKNVDALQVMIDWFQLETTAEELLVENDEVLYGLLDTRLDTMPGLLPLLDKLEECNIPKSITTSGRAGYVERVLNQLGLAERFSFRITAEDVAQGKPHPEIYLSAAAQFDVPNQQMAVLEDSDIGCRAGIGAGSVVIAVPSKFNEQHPFDGARLVADSLAEPAIFEVLGLD
jgi:HAD superfamily hydrolase (TIGR01509 family)